MKIILFACACCLCWWSASAKIEITGKIRNYDGKSMVFFHPVIEGIYAPYWKELQPSVNGSFKIEFENEGYGSMSITYKRMHFRFFHDADTKIFFEINEVPPIDRKKRIPGQNIFLYNDSLKQISLVNIRGEYADVNKFYNRNLRSSFFTTQMVDGNYYSAMVSNSPSPDAAIALLDSLKQVELQQIDRLGERIIAEGPKGVVNWQEAKDFLIAEVNSFYGAAFLNGMFLKRKHQILVMNNDSTIDRTLYNRSWEQLIETVFEQTKANLKPTNSSPDYIDFMQALAFTMTHYKQYEFPQNPDKSLDEMVAERLFKYDTALFQDQVSRFAYELSGLQLYLNDQLFYSPTLLNAVYQLEAAHATSKHLVFYKPKIEKLKANLEAAKRDFHAAKIINANFVSFDKLINRFEGKIVLVDIWATWCHPCVQEFQYKNSLKPFIENDLIEMLYISIDKPQWEDRWRQSIRINELQGNHFRADEEFIGNMWDVIGDFKGAIPRYVLIDKAGKIFKSTAARPSEADELIKQIESLIH